MEDFIYEIEKYVNAKNYKKTHSKKLQKESFNLIKRDIRTIERYQEMIYEYTSANHYNEDDEYSILEPKLDDVYWFNEKLLEELRTKKFEILDVYKYGGAKLYDGTKKRMKYFFHNLKHKYPLKAVDIKQMIDAL